MKNWFLRGVGIVMGITATTKYYQKPDYEYEVPPPEVINQPVQTQPAGPNKDLPPNESAPSVKLGKISGALPNEILIIQKSIDDLNLVLASDCVKQKILTGSFTETAPDQSVTPLSNAEIWARVSKQPITIGVTFFMGTPIQNHWSKTMGYDIGDGVVYVNRYFVKDAFTLMSVEAHEGEGHQQGFHHYKTKSTSVPYQWNDIVEACYDVLGLTQT